MYFLIKVRTLALKIFACYLIYNAKKINRTIEQLNKSWGARSVGSDHFVVNEYQNGEITTLGNIKNNRSRIMISFSGS